MSQRYFILLITFLCGTSAGLADKFTWSLPTGGDYRLSDGSPLPDKFQFQLGVFDSGFIPTASNVDDWKDHWTALTVGEYSTSLPGINLPGLLESYEVTENPAPFITGTQLYCIGFTVIAPGQSEVFLATDSSWLMPGSSALGFPVDWDINSASEVIVGDAGGSPDMIRTVSVATERVPSRSYSMWKLDHFSPSERLDPMIIGLDADPDGDGLVNALEYWKGTDPLVYQDSQMIINKTNGMVKILSQFDPTSAASVTFQKNDDLSAEGWSTATSTHDAVNREIWSSAPASGKLFWRLAVTIAD